MKYFRKVLFYLFFSLLIIFTSSIVLIVVFEDQVKGKIIRNLNRHVNTPVDVKNIEVSIFENLPFISIVLNETVVSESREIKPGTLLKAKKIALTINPVKLFYGDYSIDGIVIEDGSIMLKLDKKGLSNFQVFKDPVKSEKSTGSLHIKDIRLKNVKATVSDELRDYNMELLASNLRIDLEYNENQLDLLVKGGVHTRFIEVSDNAFLKDKQLEVALGIRYDVQNAIVSVDPGNISIHGSEYRVKGKYHITEIGEINCYIEGIGTDIQSLVSLLPENIIKEFNKYQSEGDIYFDLNIEGRLNKSEAPGVAAHFGFKHAGIKHSESDIKIEDASFEGWFATNSLKDMRNAELRIRDFMASLEGRKIEGSFTINNFVDKHVEFSIRGSADISSLFNFYKQSYFLDYSGSIEADIEFKGRLEDMKSVNTVKNISSNGQITLDNVYFNIKDKKLPFMALNGALLFNDSNVALNDLEGRLGSSHFILNGLLVNIFSYLLLENERLAITAKLESEYIDLNELLEEENDSTDGKPYSLNISKMLALNFDCDINKVVFRRFSGEKVTGSLRIKDQICKFDQVKFKDIGGDIQLEGVVDARGEDITVLTSFSMNRIFIDSIFYVFENFQQDFLVDSHLGGRVKSSVIAQMKLTPFLELYPSSLIADLSVSITNGELKNFEPLYSLSSYIPEDNLTHLTFSDLSNDIHVENETIFLPAMEVKSNNTNITIGGTHTFDQHIKYNIIVPLRPTHKIDKDAAFGAIEDNHEEGLKLYLILEGTTSDYEVKFDKRGFKKGIVSGLKEEIQELKEAFKMKSEIKKKEIVLEEDYFEWEED